MTSGQTSGPLNGVRILAFCHYLQGPATVQYLGDLGADVVKVEPLGGAAERTFLGSGPGPDGAGAVFLSGNRNARSLSIDLKRPEGLGVIKRLLSSYDVVVENYRVGVMERLGLGYSVLKGLNADLIYASASGFGRSGPLAEQPGQDLLAQSISGLAYASASRYTAPRATGAAIIDQHGASLLAMGILAAIIKRDRGGGGTRVEGNLLNSAIDLQQEAISCYINRSGDGAATSLRERPSELASWYHPGVYGIYATSDDSWIAVSLTTIDQLYRALGALEGELRRDEADHDRDALVCALSAVIGSMRSSVVREALASEGVWHAPVLTYDEVLKHPQVVENGLILEASTDYGEVRLVAHPVTYDGSVPGVRTFPPWIGEHSWQILEQAGFSASDLDTLTQRGVIRSKADGTPNAPHSADVSNG